MYGKQPTSPLKKQPHSKRPKTPQPPDPDPILTRGACAINQQSITRSFDLIPIPKFDNTMLPSNGAVLQRIFHEKDHNKQSMTTKEIIKIILPEIEAIYSKIPVEMKRKDSCERQILKLFDEWKNLKKNYSTGKISADKVADFEQELKSLCNLLASDAVEKIEKDRGRTHKQIQEDIDFVKDQMTTRKSKISSAIDHSFTQKQERILQRQIRSDRKESPLPISSHYENLEATDSSSPDEDISNDPDFKPLIQNSTKKRGPNIAKNPNILASLDRTNQSVRNATMDLAATASAFGHDLQDLTLSRSTLGRERSKFRANTGKLNL